MILLLAITNDAYIQANGNNNNVKYGSYLITDYPKQYSTETPSQTFNVNIATRASNIPEVNFVISANTIFDQNTQTSAPTTYFKEASTCEAEINIDEELKVQLQIESGKTYCVTTKQGFIIDKGILINIERGNEFSSTSIGATSDGTTSVTFSVSTDEANPQTIDIYYIQVVSEEFPTFKSYVVLGDLNNAEITSFDGADDVLAGSIFTFIKQDGTITITPNSASIAYDVLNKQTLENTNIATFPTSIVALSKYRTKQGFKPASLTVSVTETSLTKANYNFLVTANSFITSPTQDTTFDLYKVALDDCSSFEDYSLIAQSNNYKGKVNIPGQGNSLCIMSDSAFIIPQTDLTIKISNGRDRNNLIENSNAFGASSNENITFYKITTTTQVSDQDIYLIPILPNTESYLVLSGTWEGTITSEHLISVNNEQRTEKCTNRNMIVVINPSAESYNYSR